MKTLGDMGEKRLISQVIRKLETRSKPALPLHDDAQLFPSIQFLEPKQWVISTDRTPSNLRAFEWGIMSHREYGRYCVVSNVSDIAAMGGKPYGFLLNITAPRSMRVSEFKEVLTGVRDALDEYSMCLMGGDTKEADVLNLVGISIGIVNHGRAIQRDGASPGDTVSISGHEPVGLTPGAFLYYQNRNLFSDRDSRRLEPLFRDALVKVQARCEEAICLSEWSSCNSLIDNSDGIFESVQEISSASKVGIEIEISTNDVHPATIEVASVCSRDPVELALSSGADFRLIFTSNEIQSCPIDSRKIGRVTAGDREGSVTVIGTDKEIISGISGWIHFKS